MSKDQRNQHPNANLSPDPNTDRGPGPVPWIVMKFGGTSVSSADRWNTISEQVRLHLEDGYGVVVVVSALSGVTNLLNRLCGSPDSAQRDEIIGKIELRHSALWDSLELAPSALFSQLWQQFVALAGNRPEGRSPAAHAELLSFGERLSSALGASVLAPLGCVLQDAGRMLQIVEIPNQSDRQKFLASRCDDRVDSDLAARLAAEGRVHLTQGFIATDSAGATCLLGRGGSDSSAAYLAARLQAALLEIWTDVPGMFSADPRVVPDARLLQQLSFSEAQELASMGASVLHPPSIKPVQARGIPISIRDTTRPDQPGTRIEARSQSSEAQVKGVVSRNNIVVIEMDNPAMWRQAGFLADSFAVFKEFGISVDLIATSESTVTVTLDPDSSIEDELFSDFLEKLSLLTRVQLKTHCVSISLVGNAIRTMLGQLSGALDVFQDRQVHMVTQSANDLNLTLVVGEEHAEQLVQKLHSLLITAAADLRNDLGPSWLELTLPADVRVKSAPWWYERADALHGLMSERDSAFVYHLETARAAARRLQALDSISRVLYSIKANHHPALLAALAQEGLGFECVSLAEVLHVLDCVPDIKAREILFTPNFAPREEYARAMDLGVTLTIDSLHPLRYWPELFAGHELFLRVDLDAGYGHHKKVITAGAGSKFGIPIDHLPEAASLLAAQGARVVGLHTHSGSGVTHAGAWREQLQRLVPLLGQFPKVRVLDLGGGLAVPERPRQSAMDLEVMDQELHALVRAQNSALGSGREIEVWMEPGRYLAAESGVLLARVTQLKTKGDYHYVGLATGMNSLIRPALYGAYHHVVNLSALERQPDRRYRVVGPICESGDVIGEARLLPECAEGDLMLVSNAGAYGRVMSSSYNMRPPAEELILDS